MKGWNSSRVFLGLLFVLIVSGVAIAQHLVLTSSGGSVINYNEDVQRVYNVSVNNTDATFSGNITRVNITVSSSFTFAAASNGSSFVPTSFNISSNSSHLILSWNATAGLVMNSTRQFFFFNATAATPGTYVLTVVTTNGSGSFSNTSISVVINDTTRPEIYPANFSSPVGGANTSQVVVLNASIADNGVLSAVTFNITDSTNTQVGLVAASNPAGSFWNATFNTSALSGYYNVTLLANDTYNNLNDSARVQILIDNTKPSLSLQEDGTSSSRISVLYSCSDALSGLASCSIVSSGGDVEGSSVTGLDCDTEYTITATAQDYAGNTEQSSLTVQTDGCGGGSAGRRSGGGSSGGSTSEWYGGTFAADDRELQSRGSVTRDIPLRGRMSVKIAGATHYIGITSLSATTADIQVMSDPQSATLTIGQSQKFDVDNDGFYDMQVTLVSISTDRKAMLTTVYLHEEVSSTETTPAVDTASAPSTAVTPTSQKSIMSFVVILVLVALAVVLVVWYMRRRR